METTNNTNILDSVLINVNEIKDILYHYYGEKRVDIQLKNILTFIEIHKSSLTSNEKITNFINSCSEKIPILIYFPEVTITNEYNDSLLVKDLYVKFYISLNGCLSLDNFLITRTTFTHAQFESGYIHSHTPGFSRIPTFKTPCLGEGPIKSTTTNLQLEYDSNLWNLFCIELDQYVKTESITGGPYKRMTSISTNEEPISYNCKKSINNDIFFNEFFNYFLSNIQLPIIWSNSYYSIGMSISDFHLHISNKFIEWFNLHYDKTKPDSYTFKKLLEADYLKNGIYKNNRLYYLFNSRRNPTNNTKLLTFKEKDVYLKIIKDDTINFLYILDSNLVVSFYQKLIYLINFTFINNENYIL